MVMWVIPELNSVDSRIAKFLLSNCFYFESLKSIRFMIFIFFDISLFILFVFLFFREVRLDHKRFRETKRLANEHVLREVERFLKEKEYYD
jgi:hypothetical protein